jgi:hypothetical protein
MSIVDDAIKAALVGFDLTKSIDRLAGAYVRRRTAALHTQNAGWDAAKLTAQVKAEVAALQTYIAGKDPLINGTETKSPKHLDLLDQAAGFVMSGSFARPMIETAEAQYRSQRKQRVPSIVWRAATVYQDRLWRNLGPPAVVQTAALDEMLDRRLRVVEQLLCNVNAMSGMQLDTTERQWQVAGANGPWKDGFTVRNFEYPYLPTAPFRSILPQMSGWKEEGSVIRFSNGTTPTRVPDDMKSSWEHQMTRTGVLWVNYLPTSRKPADVIQRMFGPPRADHRDRCLLYCDMVGSAVNLEALWFANRRRFANDDEFNTLLDRPKYVSLGPVVRPIGTKDLDILMADDQDPAFENLDIDINDLQVGDFVRFWNSRIYSLLEAGAWGSEYSHVMWVECDAASATLQLGLTQLAGHGIPTVLYSGMASNLINRVSQLLMSVRGFLAGQITDATTSVVTPFGQTLIKWSPYEDFDAPGAWWFKVPKPVWNGDWEYANQAAVLAAVPRTVAHDPGGTGYRPPPDTDAIYFPLFQPILRQTAADGDSWRAYLRQRKADPQFRPPTTALGWLSVDGRLAQGLFYRGSALTVPVVRPRFRI